MLDIKVGVDLDIDGSYKDIMKDAQKLQKLLEQKGLKLKLNLGDINKALKESGASGSLNKFGSEMAKELIDQFSIADKEIQSKVRTISQELADLYSTKFTSTDGSYDIDTVTNKIMELGNVITSNANIVQQKLGIYDEFYNYLKGIRGIKISDTIRSDLCDEWVTLRNLYPTKFLRGKGTELDSVYQELSSKFPDIFKGQTNPTEQFRELCKAIQEYRTDVAKIQPVDAKTLGLDDSAYESIIATLEKLNALYQKNAENTSTKESVTDIENEAAAMDKVEESATTAASKKEKFADANKKVEQSAEDTTDAVQAEADVMMDMSNLDSILAGVNMQGQQGNSVFQRFGNTLREAFLAYTGANLLQDALHEVTRAGKEAIDTVKELNDLKTDLQMVTGDSSDKVGALINDYNDLAQELGATTKAVGESADAFLRQGRTMQETNQLIQDSMVLSKVAKIDSDKSAEILTATINGFQMAASEASHVNDALSAIDLASASDAGGIGESLTKVASMANNAGVSLERTAAIIATIKDVTQDSDESIGTSLKTILSRMNQIKAGKFIDAETGEALNDVEKVLNKVGISMRDANNQFEDSEVVLDRVAEKWQSFDKNTQKAVSTALAGTYQYNKLVAALDNWDKVQNLTNLAMNSDGSAESKFEVYLDSLEAKTQALQASLESLASDTIPDDLYASVLDMAKAMIDAADSSGILKSALAGLGTVGAIYTFQHLASYLGEAAQGFSDLGTAMTMTQNTIADASDMQRLLDLTQGLSQSQTRLILSTNTLTDAQKTAILMNQNMSEAEATATLQAWNLSAAQQGATASTMTLSGVLKGLYATMAANPLILVGLAVTAGVTLWQKYKQSLEEVDKKAEESKQKFDELSSEIDDLNSELETTKKRIDELANKDVSLTLVEQDELDRLRAQNDELEREIELKKYAAQMEGKRAATEAVSAINKKTESYIEYYTAEDGNTYNAERHENRIEAMQRQIALAEQLKQEQDELIQKQKELEDSYRDANGVLNYEALTKDSAYDYYNNQMDTLGSRIEYAEGKMADYYNDLSSLDDALYDDYGNIISGAEETADKLNSVYEAYLQYGRGGKTVVQNLSDYFDSMDNQAMVQKLDDAYAQYANGDISDATLKSMTEYAEVMDATGISAEGLTTYLKDLYEAKKELSDSSTDIGITEPLPFTESISQVQALSAGFDQLDKIYADVLNKEDFDWSSILNNTSFTEAFGKTENVTEEYKAAYDDFIKTISNSPDDINKCQEAFNNLATEYVNDSGALKNLTEENKQATITMLEQMGVANAEEVVTATLAHNKEELTLQNILLANSTMDLSTVTADEIQRLLDEGVVTQEVAKQLASYAVEKQYANDKVITTVGDCNNLIALMKTAEGTTEAIAKLEKLKARLYTTDENGNSVLKVISNEERANVEKAINNIAAEFNSKVSETIKVPQMTYNGGSTTKKAIEDANKASKSVSDAAEKSKKSFNWIDTLINNITSAVDKLKEKVSNTYLAWSVRNNSLTKAMEKTNELINVQKSAYDRYMQEANSVGLSQDYINKIQNGTLDLETITDESLSDMIDKYEEWYDKAQECSDAIEDLKTQLADLAKQKFDNITKYFDGLIATTEKSLNRLTAMQEDSYKKYDVDTYKGMYIETRQLIDYNVEKSKQLDATLRSMVENDYISAGSEAWRDMYNQILDINDAVKEYERSLTEIQQKEYDALIKPYDNKLKQLDARKKQIDAEVQSLELQGYVLSKGLYERQLRDYESQLATLQQEGTRLQHNLNDAVQNNGLELYSDTWIEMQSAIDDNAASVAELKNNIIELQNSLRKLQWDKFDRLQKTVSRISSESDFMMGLFDSDKAYGDDGKLSSTGDVLLGLHTQNYFSYKENQKLIQDELDSITNDLKNDPTNTTLIDRQRDLEDAMQDATKAAYDEYQAIVELAQKGYQAQIDSIKELIDAKKEQLEADKSLYEYQKNIAEKTKKITDIQKQLVALANDDSEENKAKIQQLKVDLSDAKQDLNDTQYDKWYSDQTDMLDKLYEEYEALMTDQSKNEEQLFKDMIEHVNKNANSIQETIYNIADNWGYNLSDVSNNIWQPGFNGLINVGNNIYSEIQELYKLNEQMYKVAADIGDLGIGLNGMETTISDETTANAFVEQLYRGMLGREADSAGLESWVKQLTNGATVKDIVDGFLKSDEYVAKNRNAQQIISDLYSGLLGRTADAEGYNKWLTDYNNGANIEEIMSEFLKSDEFMSRANWIRLLKQGSFAKGGMIRKVGEDGIVLARDGEGILTKENLEMLRDSILVSGNLMSSINQSIPSVQKVQSYPSIGDINISIPIDHVQDYNDFVTNLQKDNKFFKMVENAVLGSVTGDNSLKRNSYKWK